MNRFNSTTLRGPNNTISQVWLTPKWLINKIGISDLDPCAWLVNGKPIVETANHYITEDQDGLKEDWSKYESVFVNFPYSESRLWMEKCSNYNNVIALCFVRSDTKAWLNVKNATGINLIHKRIKFLNSGGIEKSNGNAPSCLIAWGEESYNRIKNIDGIYVRVDKNV